MSLPISPFSNSGLCSDALTHSGPLSGIRVLELGDQGIEYCGKLMADLGAEVIKVEPPTGCPSRRVGPFLEDNPGLERSLRFLYLNTNKRSLTLAIESPEGRQVLSGLVRSADVVVESFAPGYLVGFELGWSSLRQANPNLIMVSLTGFGQEGPYAHFQYPDIVPFAMGGIMYLSGESEGPPVTAPCDQAQLVGSTHAALAVISALWSRGDAGEGQYIDISMQECLAAQENTMATFAQFGSSIPRAGGQHRRAVPGRIFPCDDGHIHFMITAGQPGSWERFVEFAGDPPALQNPDYRDPNLRRHRAAEVDEEVRKFTRDWKTTELYHAAQASRLPCAPVNSPMDVAADRHLMERGYFVPANHPEVGPHQIPGPPYRFSAPGWSLTRSAPLLGEANKAVYCEGLGWTAHQLAAYYEAGVV